MQRLMCALAVIASWVTTMALGKPRMQEGVVVFLDALGVKGIWARAEPESVIRSWEDVLRRLHESIEKSPKAGSVGGTPECLDYNIAAFSDTVIITLKCTDDPAAHVPLVAKIVSEPFFYALLKGVYFRGVIAIGKFYQSSTLVIGPAIDEAAEWYTQPEWMGVSTAPSASFGLSRLEDQKANISKWFIKYDIPSKSGPQKNEWALAWPRNAPKEPSISGNHLTARGLILNAFANRPISVGAVSKYKNTLAFFDFVTGQETRALEQ
jgi:hypothetical protein